MLIQILQYTLQSPDWRKLEFAHLLYDRFAIRKGISAMNFEGLSVPGAEWVEIVSIRNKDGSPLADDNFRHKLFGRISLCWVAGGFRRRGLYFKGKIYMKNGEPTVVDLNSSTWCSTTEAMPVEVEPHLYDMVTNTSIYRLRILSEEEEQRVIDIVRNALKRELEMVLCQNPAADMPVS